jgi:hypothetical protein
MDFYISKVFDVLTLVKSDLGMLQRLRAVLTGKKLGMLVLVIAG